MTPEDWQRVITDAAGIGTRFVCFIGGEPTMHPSLSCLVGHALGLGMEVEIFSNLVHVAPEMWELFGLPRVRVATSWYSSDRAEHRQITGRDTFRQTLANIEQAVRREIPLRVGLISGILPGQHAAEGEELLRARGVISIGGDHLREFGRGTIPDPSQACGNCGHHRAAVLPDGTVTPCPLTRWMTAGSVHAAGLNEIMASVTELAGALPQAEGKSTPGQPTTGIKPGCNPTCVPDSYCNPLCTPGACKPRI